MHMGSDEPIGIDETASIRALGGTCLGDMRAKFCAMRRADGEQRPAGSCGRRWWAVGGQHGASRRVLGLWLPTPPTSS